MIDALALLSIRIFAYLELLRTSFSKMFILFEWFIRILSLGINSPEVMGTKSSNLEDIKLL